jgi:nucleotide-binding universal stress UspA family protein
MKRILAAVDFSDLSTPVIETAAELAIAFGSEIRIVHVEAPAPAFIGSEMSPPVLSEQHTEEVERIHEDLKSMIAYLEKKGISAEYKYLQGPVVELINEQSKEFNADLVLVGAHSHGILYRAFIGSISSGVVKTCRRPVLVIPEK